MRAIYNRIAQDLHQSQQEGKKKMNILQETDKNKLDRLITYIEILRDNYKRFGCPKHTQACDEVLKFVNSYIVDENYSIKRDPR